MGGVTIVNVLPSLLGTYGDSGNELALGHRLRARGIDVECVRVEPGAPIPEHGDIYLLGGGEDRAQALAAHLIGRGLMGPVDRGATVLAVCAGYQILGTSFTDGAGRTHPGLGLLDVETRPLADRAVGDTVVEPFIPVGTLVGFENHRGGTTLGADARPLGRVVRGVGNGPTEFGPSRVPGRRHRRGNPRGVVESASPGDGTEGAWQGRVFGTYLHGPVLALNPAFADHLLSLVVGELPALDDEYAARARTHRLPTA